MIKKNIIGLLCLLIIAIIGASTVSALPADIVKEVQIDGTEVLITDVNRLDVERGQNVPIRVELASSVAMDNVRVEATIGGYEYNDHISVSDATHNFDMEANVTYIKKLSVRFPDNVEEDNYYLRVFVIDRYSDEVVMNYKLKIDVARHNIVIRDVTYPEYGVKAGRALLFTVRVKNMGETEEDGIRVKVSIPELNLASSPDYIDTIEPDKSTSSEELYIRVPECTEAGTYTGVAEVTYDEGYETIRKEFTVTIIDSEACESTARGSSGSTESSDATASVTIGGEGQEVNAGEGGAVYPVTINNPTSEAKSFTISVEGASEWATVRISPSSTVIVGAKTTETLYVYLAAKDSTSAGDHMFAVTVSSGDATVKQMPLTANVVAKEQTSSTMLGWDKVRKGLEVGLVVLVVLLVILGLIIGINKLREEDDDNDDDVAGQTYY